MPSPPAKLYLLLWNLALCGLGAILLRRVRAALAKADTAGSPWVVPLLGGALLMVGLGLWNGEAVYMGDESMYRLGADLYASGVWSMEAPPIGTGEGQIRYEEFRIFYLPWTANRMYPMYPLGWPAILAVLSSIVPAPLINPLFGIGILLLTGYYARRFLPAGSGAGAILMMVLSASFLMNSVGFTSHPSAGILLVLAAISGEIALQRGDLRFMALSMLICAAITLVRPVNGALAMAAAGIAFWIRFGFGRPAIAGAVAASLAAVALIVQNLHTTGIWHRSGYVQYLTTTSQVMTEYGPKVFLLQVQRLANTAACSFPLLLLFLAVALYNPATRRRAAIYTAFVAATILAYGAGMPVESDSPYGERYYYESLIFLFTAAGMGWAHVAALLSPSRRVALQLACALVSVYSIYGFTRTHHALRAPHARLLAQKAELSRDAQLVFVEATAEFPMYSYWINPVRWRDAPTIFLPAPAPERRDEVARILGRPRWKFVPIPETVYAIPEFHSLDSSPMYLSLTALRFRLRLPKPLAVPEDKYANVVRGALGLRFRDMSCPPACQDPAKCPNGRQCQYARLFEADLTQGQTLGGMATAPRPFVLRVQSRLERPHRRPAPLRPRPRTRPSCGASVGVSNGESAIGGTRCESSA